MLAFSIAEKSQDEREKINVGLSVFEVAYKERQNLTVLAKVEMLEQHENLRDYCMGRLCFYREQSTHLSRASDPLISQMAELNARK